jgi:hypothetical protein
MPFEGRIDQAHLAGSFAHGPEIDCKRATSVQIAQRSDAIAQSRKKDAEFGSAHQKSFALQLRRCGKRDL